MTSIARQLIDSCLITGAAVSGGNQPALSELTQDACSDLYQALRVAPKRHGGVLSVDFHRNALAEARTSSLVEELARERVHPVFLLDEAHLLHQDTLDHLHILLNYQ